MRSSQLTTHWIRLALLNCLVCGLLSCGEEPTPGSGADEQGSSQEGDEEGASEKGEPAARDATANAPTKRDGGGGDKLDAGNRGDDDEEGGSPQRSNDSSVKTVRDGAASTDAGVSAQPAQGCTAKLLEVPDDPIARGPWETGVRTVKIGRLTVEVFYPAAAGSTDGKSEVTYDSRQWIPEAERKKITDPHAHIVGPIGGHLYRDVPIDADHGPYPPIVFIHGTASHRAASVTTNTHWASRGFVVLAADYPGLGLADQMASTLECLLPTSGAQDIPGDVDAQLAALKSKGAPLDFLSERVDMKRVAISGHSQGGCVTATLSALPDVKIVIPLSGSMPTATSSSLESVTYISGMDDSVIGYGFPAIGNTVCPLGASDTIGAYNASPGPPKVKKRVVGIAGGGHLSVTDLCDKNAAGKSSVEELQAAGVCGVGSAVIIGLPALFDCGTVDWKKGVEAVNYASTAALEETLFCRDRSKQFADLKSKLKQVGELREDVN